MANPAWLGLAYARITKETTYGTYASTNHGTASAEQFVRLHQSNPQSMRQKPEFYEIRGADGLNRIVQAGSGFYGLAGTIVTPLYPTQAGMLLGAAINLTSNDLSSYTLDWSDSIRTGLAYLGAKVKRLRLQHNATQQYAVLTIDWIAQAQGTSNVNFTAPAATAFPAELPYTHQQTSTGLTIGGSVRAKYKSLDLTVDNVLIAPRDELGTISSCFFGGRDVTAVVEFEYLTNADRVVLETLPTAALAASVVYTAPGPHTLTLDLKGTCYLSAIDDDAPLDNAGYQKLTYKSMFDRTAATDISVAAT